MCDSFDIEFQQTQKYAHVAHNDLDLCVETPPNRVETVYRVDWKEEMVDLGCMIWVEVYRHRSLQP